MINRTNLGDLHPIASSSGRVTIPLPATLWRALDGSEFRAQTEAAIADHLEWLADSQCIFFPDFTDHGPDHIREVLLTAERLIPPQALTSGAFTAADACALILSAFIHDIALHFHEQQFLSLFTADETRGEGWSVDTLHSDNENLPWGMLWGDFQREVRQAGASELERLFGSADYGPPALAFDSLEAGQWTKSDRMMIGEFLRRHHGRLAHETALYGPPGVLESVVTPIAKRLPQLGEPIGAIARSHVSPLRVFASYCEYVHPGTLEPWGCHAVYIAALLRCADALQVQSNRAPVIHRVLRAPSSPTSAGEWEGHNAVQSISWQNVDPSAIDIQVGAEHSLRTHLWLRKTIRLAESELETSSTVLAEIYGRANQEALRLTKTRLTTNLDSRSLRDRLQFVPVEAYAGSDPDLFRLVASDLYGESPMVAGRELVQNASDAIRARRVNQPLVSEPSDSEATLGIRVVLRRVDGTYTIEFSDDGIGMKPETVRDYFLRAGASYRPPTFDDSSRPLKAGHFGIGAIAMFLLGEPATVETRHASENRGIRFSVGFNSDLVEMRFVEVPVGTRIVIPLDSAKLSDPRAFLLQVAGFYRLSDPDLVVEFIDGTKSVRVDRKDVLPFTIDSPVPKPWTEIDVTGYTRIAWNRKSKQTGKLIHNGMLVAPTTSGAKTYELRDRNFRAPDLAVFDPDFRLPLTLDRFGLKSRQVPFENELLNSIGQDLAEWCKTMRPSHYPLARGNVAMPICLSDSWFPLLPNTPIPGEPSEFFVLWAPRNKSAQELNVAKRWLGVGDGFAEWPGFAARGIVNFQGPTGGQPDEVVRAIETNAGALARELRLQTIASAVVFSDVVQLAASSRSRAVTTRFNTRGFRWTEQQYRGQQAWTHGPGDVAAERASGTGLREAASHLLRDGDSRFVAITAFRRTPLGILSERGVLSDEFLRKYLGAVNRHGYPISR